MKRTVRYGFESGRVGPDLFCEGPQVGDATVATNLIGSQSGDGAHKRTLAISDFWLQKLGTQQLNGCRSEERKRGCKCDV
jgi:hypothetical protein